LLAKPTRFLDHVPSHYMDLLALVEEGRDYDWDIGRDRYV
jgi:hypothetical protein